jgi:hypothetical protein
VSAVLYFSLYLPPANLSPVPLMQVEICAGVIDNGDAWGKMIHEKNLKQKKSRDTVPLKVSKKVKKNFFKL